MQFISYLLRFSDGIKRMRNSYRNFLIQSQSRNDFLTCGKGFSSNRKSAANVWISQFAMRSRCCWCLFNLQVYRVSTNLLQFCRKLAINHRQWQRERERVLPRNEASGSSLQTTYTKATQGKQIKRSWSDDDDVNILYEKYLH